MKKLLIHIAILVMLLSLVACGAPAVNDSADDSASKQQIEVNKDKEDKTDNEQENDAVDTPSGNAQSGEEQKRDMPVATSSGSNNSGSNAGSPSNTESSGGAPAGSSGNTGSSDNSGSSADSGNTSNTGSSPASGNDNESTSGSAQQPSSGADSTPVHTHTWTSTDTIVACFDCGTLEHSHIWEPVYITEIVDDYEMQSRYFCSVCNQDVTDLLAGGASMKQHRKDSGCTSSGYYGTGVQVNIGSHEEQVLIGHGCSICDATK